uniref:Uncharacterized protein n=1 Tax=Anguilla anguilla TaxID=7936 RepID=A0A0E9W1N2_ANGAN
MDLQVPAKDQELLKCLNRKGHNQHT